MEILLEVLLEVFGSIFFEIFVEVVSVISSSKSKRTEPMKPQVIRFLLIAAGFGLGWLSLFVYDIWLESRTFQIINLIVTPLVAAGALHIIGTWKEKRDKKIVPLDRFKAAYLFALSFTIARFLFGVVA